MRSQFGLSLALRLTSLLVAAALCGCTAQAEQSAAAPQAAADLTTCGWQVIGPGGGGGIFKPTVSPHDPNLMLAHCDMTGAYISYDGGDNWRMFYTCNVPEAFEFDPVDPNVIYVAARGFLWSEDRGSGVGFLLRSADKGRSWRIVYPDMSKADTTLSLPQSRQVLPSQVVQGTADATIQKVEVDPSNNQRIFLGMAPLETYMSRGSEAPLRQAMLMVSDDAGGSWRTAAELPGRSVLGLYPGAPDGKPDEVLVITEKSGALVDVVKGAVTPLPLPAEFAVCTAGGVGKDGSVVYVVGYGRKDGKVAGSVYLSRDRGKSWQEAGSGLRYEVPENGVPELRGLAVCETRPEVAYISSANAREARDKAGAWQYGIFKTSDSGGAWQPVWLSDDKGYLTRNHEGSWLDKQWGPGWGGNPIDIGVDPHNPDLVFGSDAGRAYRSRDGGKTWKEIDSHNNPDGSYSTSGLNVTTCYGVIFDPFDANHFFITYTDIGLFHTLDYGKTWLHSVKGTPFPWTNTCYWLTFDPKVQGRAWAVWANAHDLPRDKMFGRDGRFDRNQGGVTVTADGGRSWSVAGTGMPDNAVSTCVLVDPDSPVDSRHLYVTVFDKGVYRSIDGGASWSLANNGLGGNLYAWRITRTSGGRLLLLMTRGRRGPETVPGALYSSTDGGGSWQSVALPEGVVAPHDIQVDPTDDKRLYLACWTRQGDNGVDTGGGVFRSEDGGASWKRVFDERVRVNSLAVSPASPQTIFINTFQNAAWRSDDRGESWKRLEGYRFKWGQRPNIDPRRPDLIYLTTYGGSVFVGPSTGVPGAVEDIVNMPSAWW
ncbi:hypothetical protein LLH00_09445 [bacterium]|nr:hypothetical protein [bacterium]